MKRNNCNISLGILRKAFYEKCISKAKKLMSNKKKISKKIRQARKIFERLHNLPRFNVLSKHICNFCDLLSDYFDGTYTNLPLSTIIAILGGLLYLVLPIDAIADIFAPFGWIDDAAVLAFVVAAEQNDVNEYLEWKDQQSLSGKNQIELHK